MKIKEIHKQARSYWCFAVYCENMEQEGTTSYLNQRLIKTITAKASAITMNRFLYKKGILRQMLGEVTGMIDGAGAWEDYQDWRDSNDSKKDKAKS